MNNIKYHASENYIALMKSQIDMNADRIFRDMDLLDSNSIKLLTLYDTLLSKCIYLATDSNFNDLLKPATDPRQKGLSYNWGSKEFLTKKRPSRYNNLPNVCNKDLYGIDCSGFIYQIFFLSGLNFGPKPSRFANAEYFAQPQHYIEVLNNYFNCNSCYKVERIDSATYNQIRSGDIILFEDWNKNENRKKIFHIGICFENPDPENSKDPIILFESRGNPAADCQENSENKYGRKSTQIVMEERLKGRTFHILRIRIV